jgi:hypothetical protein
MCLDGEKACPSVGGGISQALSSDPLLQLTVTPQTNSERASEHSCLLGSIMEQLYRPAVDSREMRVFIADEKQ